MSNSTLRLNWNENPYGPSPSAVRRVIESASTLNEYPAGLRELATQKVAEYLGLDMTQVLLTNGVDEAIDLLLGYHKRLITFKPGFSGYRERATVLNKPIKAIDLHNTNGYPERIYAETGDLVLIDQPHNPTGAIFPIEWFASMQLNEGATVVLDYTYSRFCDNQQFFHKAECESRAKFVFRSFSKSWGLAGIRCGVLTGSADLIEIIKKSQRFHSLDSIALAAIIGTLEDPHWIERTSLEIRHLRDHLFKVLIESDFFERVLESQSNFILAKLKHCISPLVLLDELAEQGILLFNAESLELPGWLRITVPTQAGLSRLSKALSTAANTDILLQRSTCEHSDNFGASVW